MIITLIDTSFQSIFIHFVHGFSDKLANLSKRVIVIIKKDIPIIYCILFVFRTNFIVVDGEWIDSNLNYEIEELLIKRGKLLLVDKSIFVKFLAAISMAVSWSSSHLISYYYMVRCLTLCCLYYLNGFCVNNRKLWVL